MIECLAVLISAFALDVLLGDPVYPAHPVRLIGALIGKIETILFKIKLSGTAGGILLSFIIIISVTFTYISLRWGLSLLHDRLPLVLDIFTVYSCFALRDLIKHAKPVIKSLADEDLENARASLQKIVGRDTRSLDKYAIARATIESISESFVDSFFGPVFWFAVSSMIAYWSGHETYYCVYGVSSVLIYRTTNTLDSMVGYKNDKYRQFGRMSARLDDTVNFLPARVALVALTAAAPLCKLGTRAGIRIAWRDRRKHASPNSAHTESFVAGALGIKLGGPTVYQHGVEEKPWIGDGTQEPGPEHIISTCKLIASASWISIIVCAIFFWLIK